MRRKAIRTKRPIDTAPARVPEILDVTAAAQFFTVSPDTVYCLFKTGEPPGPEGWAQMGHHEGRCSALD